MLSFGVGSLHCGFNSLNGIYAYDGVNCFGVLSPGLIFKILRLRRKIVVFTSGYFIVFMGYIIYFRKDKNVVLRHFKIEEDLA